MAGDLCGTMDGVRAHRRRHEPCCDPCKDARKAYRATLIITESARSEKPRAVRNGLPGTGPEWQPYVYGKPRPAWARAAIARAEAMYGGQAVAS